MTTPARAGPELELGAEVQFGNTAIPYAIRRTGRKKTVSIAVDPVDGGVTLTAPRDLDRARLDGLVRGRAPWILKQLRRLQQAQPRLPPRRLRSGEGYLYLGRQYRLYVADGAPGEVKLKAGRLVVPVAPDLTPDARAAEARRRLVAWYRARAAERLPERVQAWAHAAGGRPIGDLLITEPRRRWASCDVKGNLRFNWRIIQAPRRLVDYVVAHELVHLQHRDHSPAFWSALKAAQPDYRARRAALRELGPSMQW